MKKTNKKESNQIIAKIIISDLDKGGSVMIYVAKWLKELSKEIIKNAKKEANQKVAKTPTYNKKFVAKLYK